MIGISRGSHEHETGVPPESQAHGVASEALEQECTPDVLLSVARQTIEAAQTCFLITVGQEGLPSARVMAPFPPESDFTIWMGARPRARKIREIAKDNRAVLGYSHAADGAYLSVAGTVTVVDCLDARRRYWIEDFRAFWPDGPEGDDYVLLKFVPSRMELMNVLRGVAADPTGLGPVVLVRSGDGWIVAEG